MKLIPHIILIILLAVNLFLPLLRNEPEIQYIVITKCGDIPDSMYYEIGTYRADYKNHQTGAYYSVECIPPCEFPRDSAIWAKIKGL